MAKVELKQGALRDVTLLVISLNRAICIPTGEESEATHDPRIDDTWRSPQEISNAEIPIVFCPGWSM